MFHKQSISYKKMEYGDIHEMEIESLKNVIKIKNKKKVINFLGIRSD